MSATSVVVSVLCVVLACLVKESVSCNGYTLKLNTIKNCGSNDIIKIENFDLTLDKECNIVPKGCVTVTKAFKTAGAHFVFEKPPMPKIEGNLNLCRIVGESKDLAKILTDLAVPSKCPVEAQKICIAGEKKHNIGRIRNQLGLLAGNISLKVEIQHDSGNTCVDVNSTIHKG